MKTNLKNQILWILKKYPQSRDSDLWLTMKLWCEFYPTRIHQDKEDSPKFVYLKDIMELPREDDVKRWRAKIQNDEHLYLPTSWEVAKQRKMKEEEYHTYFSMEYKRL